MTEANLINHLNSRNFPTVEIAPKIDGKGLGETKTNTGSIYNILFQELFDTPLIEKGLSNTLIYNIGNQMATFHLLIIELSDLHRLECGTQFLVEYLRPQIQKFLADRHGDLGAVEKILTQISDNLDNARDEGYRYRLIHGDFQGNNILVKDDKIIIFDFEYSFKRFQIMDIANFTLYLEVVSPNNGEKLADAFLKGYRSVLSTYEITQDVIKSFEVVKSVMYLGILANRAKRLGKEAYEFWLNALLRYLNRVYN